MDKVQNISPEELAAEKAGLQVVKEDEIRSNIIAEYGFDEVDDSERIEKLVAKEIDHQKKLSSAIGQKIKHREAENELRTKIDSTFPPPEESKKDSMSLKDIRALSDVHDDDVDDIIDFAKYKGISISEAKAHPAIQALLKDKQEKRETAKATNTGAGRRGPSEVPDEALIEKADKGVLSEDEMTKAAQAIMEQRKKAARGQT